MSTEAGGKRSISYSLATYLLFSVIHHLVESR
jgi:hypothetical protein